MKIGEDNPMVGNEAMAAVLLLYYQIVLSGGISNDETVYLDPERFNGFDFLAVEVEEGCKTDINETLIRQGAVIYLLCDLNDQISEYEEDYLSHEITQRVLRANKDGKLSSIPEAEKLVSLVSTSEKSLDYKTYHELRDIIYRKYVLGTFGRLVQESKP
jgi:hypothetical protein